MLSSLWELLWKMTLTRSVMIITAVRGPSSKRAWGGIVPAAGNKARDGCRSAGTAAGDYQTRKLE